MGAANLGPGDDKAALVGCSLSSFRSLIGSMACLSSCYESASRTCYSSSSISNCTGKGDQDPRAAHERLFARWLLSPICAQHTDIEIWLRQDCGDLARWLRTEQYQSLIPPSAMAPEEALFLCDIEVGLIPFRNTHAPDGRSRSKYWVIEVLSLIERHAAPNLKVIGGELKVSAQTLGGAFYTRTGLRFRTYSRIARLLKAIPHLANSRCPVKEASGLANYPEPSTFIRDCRELLGVTPIELQQRLAALAGMSAE